MKTWTLITDSWQVYIFGKEEKPVLVSVIMGVNLLCNESFMALNTKKRVTILNTEYCFIQENNNNFRQIISCVNEKRF